MVKSTLTLNGIEHHGDALELAQVYMVIQSIINAGGSEMLVLKGAQGGVALTSLRLVNKFSTVSVDLLGDVPGPVGEALRENLDVLTARYFRQGDSDDGVAPAGA